MGDSDKRLSILNQQRVINFYCDNPALTLHRIAFKLGLPASGVIETIKEYREEGGFNIYHSSMNYEFKESRLNDMPNDWGE